MGILNQFTWRRPIPPSPSDGRATIALMAPPLSTPIAKLAASPRSSDIPRKKSLKWADLKFQICLARFQLLGWRTLPLVDCAGRVCSPDGCDAERPDLIERRLFRASARRAGPVLLFCDVMTVRTRLLGELHFSSLMTLESVMGGARLTRNHVSS